MVATSGIFPGFAGAFHGSLVSPLLLRAFPLGVMKMQKNVVVPAPMVLPSLERRLGIGWNRSYPNAQKI